MKRISGLFFLVFTVCFSRVNIQVNPYELKNEMVSLVAEENRTIFSLVTNDCRITGLGNAGIQFEVVGSRILVNDYTGQTIKLENIYLDTTIGNRIDDILDARGQVKFKVRTKAIKDGKLGWGYYSSKNLWLKVRSIFFNEIKYIPIKFQVFIYESLKVETTEMNFGVHVIGERITTKSYGAEPGKIIITGHPWTNVKVDYPSEVLLKNENNNQVVVKLSDEIKNRIITLRGNGECKLELHGEVKNSNLMEPGKYNGEITVKVRYD